MPPVLVVDDDRDIRESLSFLLQGEGYTAVTASNGREALDFLGRTDLPCLILLDLLMPVMDGIEFLSEMRSDRRLKDVPVVVISAASTVAPPPDVPRFNKPITLDRLLDVVEQHCGPAPQVC